MSIKSQHTPMDLRLTTLKATLKQVNQARATDLRKQLRQTLYQHCTIHLPAPPHLQCHTLCDECQCIQTAQLYPIPIPTTPHAPNAPTSTTEDTRPPGDTPPNHLPPDLEHTPPATPPEPTSPLPTPMTIPPQPHH